MIEPVIVIDTREQTPLKFSLATVRDGLTTGDYSIQGWEDLFSIERKSVSDLVSCCAGDNRERFERELRRMRGYRFRRLMIVGTPAEILNQEYHSQMAPQSVFGSLSAWEVRFDIPVVFGGSEAGASAIIERWATYFVREMELIAQKIRRITKSKEGKGNNEQI